MDADQFPQSLMSFEVKSCDKSFQHWDLGETSECILCEWTVPVQSKYCVCILKI